MKTIGREHGHRHGLGDNCIRRRCMSVASILCCSYHTHCKKRGVTEHPRGAIFYCFRGNSMGYHGNSKILLPWGVQLHRIFYSALIFTLSCSSYNVSVNSAIIMELFLTYHYL